MGKGVVPLSATPLLYIHTSIPAHLLEPSPLDRSGATGTSVLLHPLEHADDKLRGNLGVIAAGHHLSQHKVLVAKEHVHAAAHAVPILVAVLYCRKPATWRQITA